MENNMQEAPQKKSKTILGRLTEASSIGEKALKRIKTAIRITLAALTLGAAAYAYKQIHRSPEQVKKDAKVVREEHIPNKYTNSTIRAGSAKLGSKIGEWFLTRGKRK